jgi:hypothetical protein
MQNPLHDKYHYNKGTDDDKNNEKTKANLFNNDKNSVQNETAVFYNIHGISVDKALL